MSCSEHSGSKMSCSDIPMSNNVGVMFLFGCLIGWGVLGLVGVLNLVDFVFQTVVQSPLYLFRAWLGSFNEKLHWDCESAARQSVQSKVKNKNNHRSEQNVQHNVLGLSVGGSGLQGKFPHHYDVGSQLSETMNAVKVPNRLNGSRGSHGNSLKPSFCAELSQRKKKLVLCDV